MNNMHRLTTETDCIMSSSSACRLARTALSSSTIPVERTCCSLHRRAQGEAQKSV